MLRRSPLTPEDTTLLVRSLYHDHHGNVIQTHESNTLGGQQRDYDCTYRYDLNGNVTALTRKGVDLAMPVIDYTVWNYGTIDDLSLSYEGNRLTKVTDQSPDLTYEGAMDFRDGVDRATEYTYDANGNLTSDRNKGITAIAYNVLNLPSRVEFDDGHIIRYRYAADGRKLRTEYVLSNYTVIDNPVGPLIPLSGGSQPMGGGTFTPGGDGLPDPENQLESTLMTRDYCGNHIYRDGVLERVMGDYGYWAGGSWYYHVKDYQGNVRAVIDHIGVLQEVNNYYPYGSLMGGGSVGNNASVQPYKYGTKELDRQNGLDWYDSQARMYDPLIARTPTVDPLAEKYYPISPYAWCAGNPILFIDNDGNKLVFADCSSTQFQHDFQVTKDFLDKNNVGDILTELDNIEEVIIIRETDGKSKFDPNTNTISWNPTGGVLTDLGIVLSPATVLNHEADHALQGIKNPEQKERDKGTQNPQYDDEEENRVINGSERRTAEALGEIGPGQNTRTTHSGQECKTLGPTTTERDYSVKYATDLDTIEVIAEGKNRLTK